MAAIKIEYKVVGEHAHCKIFDGPDDEHLALSGEITLSSFGFGLFAQRLMNDSDDNNTVEFVNLKRKVTPP